MKWVVLLCVVSSCINSDLVPCGSLSCPVGSICIEATETCVIQGQLDACANSADDDLCVTSIGNGVCLDGVCRISRCGDGTVDPGEVCDDGNLANGDGCRQDCRSDETCGNGLLDQFERCDCGSSADSVAKGCTMPNSEDVNAECDPACSRTCGDAIVTGFEQCDGATVPASCAQFGFYTGTPSCTDNCSLDTSGCVGRCGDGVLQVEHGEECDGASPPVGSCLAFGRDFGVLGCSSTCTPAVTSTCHYMGWRPLFSSSQQFLRVAGNARGAIATTDPDFEDSVYVRWDGVESHRDNLGWRWTAATPTVLIAAGPTSLGWFDGTWHDIAAAPGAGAQIAATPAGFVFAVRPDCTVSRIELTTGTTMSITSATGTTCFAAVTLAEHLYVGSDTGLHRWDGASWVEVLAGETSRLSRARPGHLVARRPTGDAFDRYMDVDVSTTPATEIEITTLDSSSGRVAVDMDGTIMIMPEAEGIEIPIGKLRARGHDPSQLFRLEQSEDGTILGVGYGAYRFEPRFLALEDSPSEVVLDFDFLPDGAAAYCGDGVLGWLDSVDGSGARPWPTNFNCWHLIGDPRGEHFAGAEVFTGGGSDGVYRWDDDLEDYVLEIPGRVDDLAGTPGAAFAVVDWVLLRQTGPTWTPVALPDVDCQVEGVETHGTDVYVLTQCPPSYHATIQRWTGTALEPIATYPSGLYELTVTPDGAVFASGGFSKLVRLDGTSFVEMPVAGLIMAAASKDDLYIGGFDPLVGAGTLYHLDHGVLSQIRAPYRVLDATADHLYAFDPEFDSIAALPRLPVRLAGKGL